jgi:hypothetical protein
MKSIETLVQNNVYFNLEGNKSIQDIIAITNTVISKGCASSAFISFKKKIIILGESLMPKEKPVQNYFSSSNKPNTKEVVIAEAMYEAIKDIYDRLLDAKTAEDNKANINAELQALMAQKAINDRKALGKAKPTDINARIKELQAQKANA